MKVTRRQVTEKIAIGLCLVAAMAVVGMLFLIISEIFLNGLPSLSWYFVATPENATPGMGQGIANAVAGTILISLCAVILAAPFGFGTAVYMKRYARDNGITRSFRFLLEVLSGTPSIVVGVFGFLIFVVYMKKITGGFSLIAGALALAILIMPVIERAIEDAIDRVPGELEEGSYALGADKWQTISGITIPTAFTGILTGFTLGFGRAAEESAVVILTAGYTQYLPEFAIRSGSDAVGTVKMYPLQDQVATLPYTVYHAFQNQAMVKASSGFAAAFVLVVIVFTINISGKMLLQRTVNTGQSDDSLIATIRKKLSKRKKRSDEVPVKQEVLLYETGSVTQEPSDQSGPSFIDTIRNHPLLKKISTFTVQSGKKENPPQVQSHENNEKKQTLKAAIRTFLRTLLPFAIPSILLLLIAFLAGIPPLQHILGPADPSLTGLFAAGLTGIVTVAGLIFGLLFAKRGGAFRPKNRRTGYMAVVTGFCILFIAGIICSSAAAGLFNTGEQTATQSAGDRSAQLAAMLASGQLGDDSGSTVSGQNAAPTAPAPSAVPTQTPGAALTPTVPVKDALSLGESYQYGDPTRTCDATVYDYKVLPFYFWWFVDYNRFVEQDPGPGNKYLVVFIRVADIGTKSAILPSADQFYIENNGNTYTHLPYVNLSALSTNQSGTFSDLYISNPEQVPYQWIRELGQDRRDYAFLTGYDLYGGSNSTANGTATVTLTTVPTPTVVSASGTIISEADVGTNNGQGFFIKPGPSNAIDGYLIYEVPEDVVMDNLNETYVQVSFNANSGTRWRLK